VNGKKHIRAIKLPEEGKIRESDIKLFEVKISFKYLHTAHGKFQYDHEPTAYFLKLLARFRDVCQLTSMQMRTTHKEALRCHEHLWEKTTEPNGFGLKGQLAGCEGWQFQLSSNEHGRVHGFFLSDVFFVVWLDPEHKLYAA
jgi:hypothetical protein